jgi:hypothetical protein
MLRRSWARVAPAAASRKEAEEAEKKTPDDLGEQY